MSVDERVAVVGIGALFPGAPTTAAFWRDLLAAADRTGEVPRTHWLAEDFVAPGATARPDKVPTGRGAFLGPTPFPFAELGIPPATIPATDTAQLLALLVAKRVLLEATGGRLADVDRSRMAVILGVASATELVAHMAGRLQIPLVGRAMRAAGVPDELADDVTELLGKSYVPWQPDTFPGLLGNVVAGRIANRLDLGGSNYVVDAACAGSLAAVDAAVGELVRGRADLVVTGGVDALNDILMVMCFAQTGALSPSGRCRPFGADADGTLLGEGVGLLALRRLEDAERDGDRIYAVIRGIGSSSDGRGTSIYAPLASGQVRALERAYVRAGVSPATVGLVEAHGTGTRAGDAAEVAALRVVFEASGVAPRSCALGSVKGQIGHTKAAAGAAGLIKAVLALHQRVLPPTTPVTPNPSLGFDDPSCPFHLARAPRPWIAAPDAPRRAAVSALGFGGTNFHVVAEAYAGPAPRPHRLRSVPSELVLVSGPDRATVAHACRDLAARARRLAVDDGEGLARIAAQSQRAFHADDAVRAFAVAGSGDALADALDAVAGGELGGSRHPASEVGVGEGSPLGAVAWLAPGQGSQRVGMTADLAIAFDAVRAVWDRAADLAADVFPPPGSAGPEAERALTSTERAQPSIAVAAWASSRLLAAVGLPCDATAGHSLGELVAWALAGGLDEDGLVRAARARGARMREVAGGAPGAMAAVTWPAAQLRAWLGDGGHGVVLANHNAPDQHVISGTTDAVARAEALLQAAGANVVRLPVGAAFHSPVVASAAVPFRADLGSIEVHAARVPVWCNATAAVYPAGPSAVRDDLANAIAREVRFVEMVQAMWDAGIRVFVEVGPGSVLTRLVGRCLEGRPHAAVALDSGRDGVTGLWLALGQLAAAGVPFDPAPLWTEFGGIERFAADPPPALSPTVDVSGANVGKPAPPAVPARRAPVAPAPALVPATHSVEAWAAAVRELHAPAIAAQLEYQRLMAETHTAFLRSLESSAAGIGRALGFGTDPAATPIAPVSLPAATSPVAAPAIARPDVAMAPVLPTPAPVDVARPVGPGDVLEVVLGAVAEKTGYPRDTLRADQDLERDLGIDSIKRVEIVSAVRERVPTLPELDPGLLGKLATIGDVAKALDGGVARPTPVAKAPAEVAPRTTVASPGASAVWFERTLVPVGATGFGVGGLWSARWVVIGGGGLRQPLVDALRARGVRVDPADDVSDVSAAIVLHGLEPGEPEAQQLAVFEIARAVAKARGVGPRWLVTVQDSGQALAVAPAPVARAWCGGIAALARTVAAEWDEGGACAVDIAAVGRPHEEVAHTLAEALCDTGGIPTTAIGAQGGRSRLAHTPFARPSGPLSLADGDVVVVSGGAKGVTRDALLGLAAVCRPRIALLGRSAADAEVHEATAALAARGIEVRYAAIDVRDPDAVRGALDEVRAAWGPIRGVIHGAGVLADGLLERRSSSAGYARVVDTKLGGWRALLAATAGDPLTCLVAFASVAAVAGSPGQADYAAANESLAHVCAAEATRRGPGVRVAAALWGPWDGGMVRGLVRERFERMGVPLLAPDRGGEAFADLVRTPASREQALATVHPVIVAAGTPAPATPATASVRIDAQTMPELGGHRIGGAVVLPMVTVADLFARLGAASGFGTGSTVVLRDLHVVKPVRLDAFYGDGHAFDLRAAPTVEGLAVTLADGGGGVRYRGVLCDDDEEPRPGPPRRAGEGPPLLYGRGALFHGPSFQVLGEVVFSGPDHAWAEVRGWRNAGWLAQDRRMDPAALDGGLQVALLAGLRTRGAPSLPLRIGELRWRCAAQPHDRYLCTLVVREHTHERSIYDVTFADTAGTPVGALSAVEMYRLPPGAEVGRP